MANNSTLSEFPERSPFFVNDETQEGQPWHQGN